MTPGVDAEEARGPTGPGATPLVPALLAPPEITVPRPRLFAELDRGATVPVTVVTAPAGSGKTVLVSQWASRRPQAVAWLTVEPSSAAGGPFWAAFLGALRDGAPACRSGRLDAVDEALAAAGPLIVVLDEFHLVRDRETLESIDALVAHLPSQVRLVICSRYDPPLSIHRLRLQGQLVELRAADLAFDLDEARELLALDGVDVSPEDLALLVRRTEGWAAALRLAALSLRRSDDPHGFICAFTGDQRLIADYLVEQVLASQPPAVRDFLLHTCIPDRICGELADALTGREGGHAQLLALEHDNLLITRVDEGVWFRYHPLLLELLRSQLVGRLPTEVPVLHRRAAGWFGANWLVCDALDSAVRGADWETTIRLIAESWLALFVAGDGDAVAAALARLPDSVLETSPEAGVAAAMTEVLERGDFAAAEAMLRRAITLAGSVPPERRPQFERAAAVVRVVLDRARGDLPDAADALALLARPQARGGDELSVAAVGLLNAGLVVLFADGVRRARPTLEDALDLARVGRRDFVVLSALAGVALLETCAGRLEQAVEAAEEALAVARDNGWTELTRMVPVYGALAWSALERADLERAEVWLSRCRAAAVDETDPIRACLLALLEARLAATRRETDTALTCLRRAARELDRWEARSWLERVQVGLMLRVLLDAARLDDAREVVATLGPDAAVRAEVAVASARLALAEGDPDRALALLAPLAPSGADGYPWAIDAALAEALAHEQLLDSPATAAAVERALELAEPERIVEPIVNCPDARRLLAAAVRRGTMHRGLVEELLELLGGASAADRPDRLREPLTARELAVLRYLPTSLSASEIASELFVSTNTVKTHMRHLYAKLGVGRRADAVSRARALKLLGAPLDLTLRV